MLSKGLDLRIDAKVCRRLAETGCPYGGDRPASVLSLVEKPATPLGDVVVIDVGYNDDPGDYGRDIDRVMQALARQGVTTVIWVTMQERRPLYRATNAAIQTAAKRWPQIRIADWDDASRARGSWFVDDGLHLSSAGALGLARFLRPLVVAWSCTSSCQRAAPDRRHRRLNSGLPLRRGGPYTEDMAQEMHAEPTRTMLPVHQAGQCSVAATSEIVGSKWTVLIVHDLSEGPRRFTAARARVRGHQPAHARRAAPLARGGGDRRPSELRRVAAARRVRADREGRRAEADHRRDAALRARVARLRGALALTRSPRGLSPARLRRSGSPHRRTSSTHVAAAAAMS